MIKQRYSCFRKSLIGLALASTSLIYTGCDFIGGSSQIAQKNQQMQNGAAFTNFGEYSIKSISHPAMVAADFDGDGAIDIAVVSSYNNSLTIYRNNLPQKKKTNVLEQVLEQR